MLVPRRVLIADDDLEVRRGVVDCLRPLGLELHQAETGDEAVEIVRTQIATRPLHLLVLDMHMPGITGLEVLAQVSAIVSEIASIELPCIFYSGNAADDVERRALEAGARAFLHKPVEPRVLREEVVRALGGDLFYEIRSSLQ